MRRWLCRVSLGLALLAGFPSPARSQAVRGVVVDQTGLPLPGATVELMLGPTLVTSHTTGPDGAFEIDAALAGSTIVVKLAGFETVTVPRADAGRIVLPIARATETTDVVAPVLVPSSPSAALLGSNLTADTVARLPSARLKARESLPLLPSVVRGPDGLMLGGARPHESPVLLDGFDVTDPASGTSSINLPFEAVRGVDVLRDPMAVTYGGLLGGLVRIESRTGGEKTAIGVQGFIPRPRLTNPGAGRIEGIFPRVYAGGQGANGRIRYFAAAEYDFERIPVPEVTQGSGPNVVEKSTTVFGRLDIQTGARSDLTLEGLVFPSTTESVGLSTRRDQAATADIVGQDRFAGVTNRYIFGGASVFTIKVGVLTHDATLTPNGSGLAYLTPAGWRGNWFAAVNRRATRYSAAATWERSIATRSGGHDVAVTAALGFRRLRGSVSESPVRIEDDEGRLVRTVEFGAPSALAVQDRPHGIAVRDVWRPIDRLQIDAGARLDRNTHHGGAVPSARVGVRWALDASDTTVLKAGVGNFIGSIPLSVESFSAYPTRTERRYDVETGQPIDEAVFQPTVERLRFPRAVAATFQIERQIMPRLDALVGYTDRRSSRLATLSVPSDGGPLAVRSSGSSTYREVQVSVRKAWEREQQLFVSYVRSYASGELNDFAALFQAMDAPLVQPGGRSRMSTDARNRVIAWGTFNLPRKSVVSPVVEWRSGFPYSALDEQQRYAGEPNGRAFPAFMAIDLVAYKNFTVKRRHADLGVQLFNLTNHFNPRGVYPVAHANRAGQFTDSVGRILRGFMLIKW